MTDNLEKKLDWRKTAADTFSMISFSFIVEAQRELMMGMTLEQTLYSRLLGVPIDFFIGGPYGIYANFIRKRMEVKS